MLKHVIASVLCLAAFQAQAQDRPTAAADQASKADAAYLAGDYKAAAALWEPLARDGSSTAQYKLGLLYDLGQGVPGSGAEAFRWYLKAARQALPEAEFNVAVMLDDGQFMTQDEKQAAMWYARAASHGLPRAQYDLAQLYDDGRGVPQNQQAAFEWYSAAASKIPAAASHVAVVSKASVDASKNLKPPVLYATPDSWLATHSLELAWIEPEQPTAVRYYVSVISPDAKSSPPLFEGVAPASALAVQIPEHVKTCAWRVYAVDAAGARYAASPWQRVTTSNSAEAK